MIVVFGLISLFSSLAYGAHFTLQPPSWPKTICKAFPIGALGMLALYEGMNPILTIALFCGALGDIALSRSGERNFIIGLGAFLVGHLFYIGLFTGNDVRLSFGLWPLLPIGLLILMGGAVYVRLYQGFGPLRVPVFAYVLVSVLLGAAAFSLPLASPFIWAILGASLFILSDILLAFDLFDKKLSEQTRRKISITLWFCYWAGQCLILLSYSGWL